MTVRIIIGKEEKDDDKDKRREDHAIEREHQKLNSSNKISIIKAKLERRSTENYMNELLRQEQQMKKIEEMLEDTNEK